MSWIRLTERLFRKESEKSKESLQSPSQEGTTTTMPGQEDIHLAEENTDLTPLGVIKTEANFANLPFFALSRQGTRKRKTEYRTTIERDGEKLEVSWKVTADPEYGYPGPFDRKVHKALEYLIFEQGFPVENPIPFTTYRLLKILDLSDTGENYKKVREGLRRIRATNIESEGAFFFKTGKRYISDSFGIYDRVVLKGQVDAATGETVEQNLLYLGSWYLASLNAHYVKPIDFDYLKSLKSDVAGRLYELLGLKFYGVFLYGRPYWRIAYKELCGLLPIATQRYYAHARRYLEPAHTELTETKFLAKVEWEKETRKDWFLTYYPGKRAREEFERARNEKEGAVQLEFLLEEKDMPGQSSVVTLLTERGVSEQEALRLVKEYADRVPLQVEVFDWIQKNQPDQIKKNPAGYLRNRIVNGWAPPEGFKTKAQIEEAKKQNAARQERIDREARQKRWQQWQAMTPEVKVPIGLSGWKREFRKENGRDPTDQELKQKQQEFFDDLSALDAMVKADILGNEH